MMVVLKGLVPMAFGGTQEPAAYGELVSIGGLNPDVNKKLSADIASIVESKLSIPKFPLLPQVPVFKGKQTLFVVYCSFVGLH
uniref:Macrophage migration inhibitory factor-like protein n=1 Tax=Aegilops tauschii subsp. strangulata TaxID=200361 RepID=A0A453LJP4_AEGTS